MDAVEAFAHATRNKVYASQNRGDTGLAFRRLASLLAGRLEPRPPILSGDGRKTSLLRRGPALTLFRSVTGIRTDKLPTLCVMPKTPKVVSIRKEIHKARLIASDTHSQRIILGIGNERIAYDFDTRITHLPPETGDRPAAIVPIKKLLKKEPA